jgi:hypothetical protein
MKAPSSEYERVVEVGGDLAEELYNAVGSTVAAFFRERFSEPDPQTEIAILIAALFMVANTIGQLLPPDQRADFGVKLRRSVDHLEVLQ